jgi:DNA-binding beta-propeller fold protein YncE
MREVQRILVVMIMCAATAIVVHSDESHYRIASRIHVEGDGFWDLLTVDDSTGRLFVSHGMVVDVVDTRTGKLVAVIQDTKGVHGIALARDLKKGFITCGRDSSVVIFNLDSLRVTTRLPVTGKNPDAILYELSSHRIFAFNGGSANATVIDGTNDEIIGTVALGGKPELPATDGKGTVFVNLEDKNMVDVIDANALKVKAEWPIAPGEGPTGLALDSAARRLFITCNNKMMIVMDADKGTIVGNVPIGERVDGADFDPGLKRAYSSNGDGTLTVVEEVDKNNFKVLENVVTQVGARTLAVDKETHHIFLPTAEFGPAPAPTPEHPRPRPTIIPGSFVVLDAEPVK